MGAKAPGKGLHVLGPQLDSQYHTIPSHSGTQNKKI